jgi:hypothetical protein
LGGYVIERDVSPTILAGPFFNPANNHSYYLVVPNTWQGSEAWAVSLGGHLATINDAAENAWVLANLVSPNNRQPWIGLNGPDTNPANYTWISGEPIGFPTPWQVGEPNGVGAPPYGVNFPAVWGGLWNNAPMDNVIESIAEVPGLVSITTNFGSFYFPEESLQALVGDFSLGTWTLEVWDNRAGANGTNDAQLLSWQLRFILETEQPTVTPLFDGISYTNTLSQCRTQYFSVDVPPWVDYVTNTLIFATPPPGVRLLFSQTDPTDATNLIFGPSIGPASFTLSSNSIPLLAPGARYFLAVETPCPGTNTTFALQVDFGVNAIVLTNMVPYTNTIAGGTNQTQQLYVYTVTNNAAVRAQFEIFEFPAGDLTLVARRGLPPPTAFNFDYLSSNPTTNGELIVVFTNSTPVALGPGNWYLTAINNSTGAVSYTIMASEWAVTGRPFAITNWGLATNEFCITWDSLPGVHYYVQGVPTLGVGDWFNVSPTITATNYSTTYCIPLPSPFNFFRVAEGLALVDVPGPAPILDVTIVTNGVLLEWTGSVTAQYDVQWSPSLVPPPGWTSFTNVITSTNNFFWFLDDGSQTGGFDGTRFYRVRQLP